MSTKTLRKRIALVAVSALGFGVISAVPSSAAPVTAASLGTVTSTLPTITRTGYTNVITLTHTDPGALTGGLGLAVLQQPATSTVTLEASNDTTGLSTSTAFDFNPTLVGTYVLRPYIEATAGGTYDAGTDTLVGSNITVTVVGAPASFTFGSSSVSTGPTGEKEIAVNVLDSNGNTTLLGSAFISITVTDSTNTTAAVVSTSTGGSGQVASLTGTNNKIFVKDTDAGSTVTVSGLLSVSGTTAQTVTYTTVAVSTAEPTDATLATPATGNFKVTGTTALSRTYSASLAVTSFTATVSGLTAGTAFKAAIATSGSATVAVDNSNPVADANGVGTVVITATGAASSDTVTLTVDKSDTSSSPAGTIVITYSTPAAAFGSSSTSPAGSTSNFTAGGAAKSITATIQDQYGQAIAGAYATASYTTVPTGVTAPTIASAVANASGVATLSTTIPSTVGTYVVTVTAKNSSGTTIGSSSAITYIVTATGGPGALAISSGVNTSTVAYAVTSDDNGAIAGTGAAASYLVAATQTTGDYTTIVVNVKDDAGSNVQYATVTATPGTGVYVNSAAPSSTALSGFNGAADLAIATDASGNATFYVVGTLVGTSSISFSVGTSSVSGSFYTVLHALDNAVGRVLTLNTATVANTSSAVNQVTATVVDIWGNAVPGVSLSGAITGAAGRFTGGGRAVTIVTDSSGKAVFEVTSNAIEAGTGTLTVSATTATAGNGTIANMLSGDLTTNLSTLTAAGTASATAAITVTASTTKSAELLAIEAIQAKAAADKAESDAKIALLQAALDAAATKAAADKAALEAAIKAAADKAAADTAAAKAAAVAAAEAAADAAAEAIDAGNNAYDAAGQAGEAADAATAAAEQAGEDAVAAAEAAGAAAVAAAEAAQEAAAEATDAANAATDAANASAEAADAATAAAQDAADAVAALSTQVSEMISALKKQITALTNLVIKIQKKVKA